nr:hypothetical protein [Aeromonas veronii]
MGWDHFRTVPRSVAGWWLDLGIPHFRPALGSIAWRCPIFPNWDFRAVPRSVAGIPSFCLKGILRAVLGPDAGCSILLIQGFATGHPLGPSLGVAFCPWDILQQAIPLSLIRGSPCSTNGYSRLIILTSYLS